MPIASLELDRRRAAALVVATAATLAWGAPAGAQAPAADARVGYAALRDGHTVLFRHAEAPGTGDPPGFRLEDCSTQRNLSDAGRAQARRLGERFRAEGVRVAVVRTSQWCRTRDTAELAFPGQARDDADFNSFFGRGDAREAAQTEAARRTIAGWRGPGVQVVTTHQVNITALTGIVPASGEGVVVEAGGDGLRVVGRLRP